jgi:signal transduction histidine kinase
MINLARLTRNASSWLRPEGPVTLSNGVLLYAPNVIRAGAILFCVVGVIFSIPYSLEHWDDPRLVATRLFVVGLSCVTTLLAVLFVAKYYRACVMIGTLLGITVTLSTTSYMDGPNINPHAMLVFVYVLGAGLCLGRQGAVVILGWLVLNVLGMNALAALGIWPSPTSISVDQIQRENTSAMFFMLLSLTPVLLGYLAVVERSIAELRQSYVDQAYMLQRLIAARESERKHLSHLLHEGAIQDLGALHLALQRHAPSEEAILLVDSALAKLRNLSSGLHPPMLDFYGLEAALEQLAVQRGGAIEPQTNIERLERLAPHVEIALFRIAQEALTNVQKHSNARRAWMRFGRVAGDVVLEIRDDGTGFDVDSTLRRTVHADHFGLATMHELATSIGGRLQITSAPRQGTTITVTLPYNPRTQIEDALSLSEAEVLPQSEENRSLV